MLESVEPKPKPSVQFDTHDTVIPPETHVHAPMQTSQLYPVLPPYKPSSTATFGPADNYNSHNVSRLLNNGRSAPYQPLRIPHGRQYRPIRPCNN